MQSMESLDISESTNFPSLPGRGGKMSGSGSPQWVAHDNAPQRTYSPPQRQIQLPSPHERSMRRHDSPTSVVDFVGSGHVQPMLVPFQCPHCMCQGSAPMDCLCLCVTCGNNFWMPRPPANLGNPSMPLHHHQHEHHELELEHEHELPAPKPRDEQVCPAVPRTKGGRGRGEHRRSPAQPPAHLWKTKMCVAGEDCKFGEKCWFAHSMDELRGDGGTLPKNWKTSMCRASAGACKYGKHCWFAHTEEELRGKESPPPIRC